VNITIWECVCVCVCVCMGVDGRKCAFQFIDETHHTILYQIRRHTNFTPKKNDSAKLYIEENLLAVNR